MRIAVGLGAGLGDARHCPTSAGCVLARAGVSGVGPMIAVVRKGIAAGGSCFGAVQKASAPVGVSTAVIRGDTARAGAHFVEAGGCVAAVGARVAGTNLDTAVAGMDTASVRRAVVGADRMSADGCHRVSNHYRKRADGGGVPSCDSMRHSHARNVRSHAGRARGHEDREQADDGNARANECPG